MKLAESLEIDSLCVMLIKSPKIDRLAAASI